MDRTTSTQQIGRPQRFDPLAWVLFRLGAWHRRRHLQKALRVSEALLRDIGLTPDDVEEALNAPLDQGASDEVLRTVRARAGNW